MAAATSRGSSRATRCVVTIVCRYRPNRTVPRRFTKADAVRVVCAVISGDPDPLDPATHRELLAEAGIPSAEIDERASDLAVTGSARERNLDAIVNEVRARCVPRIERARSKNVETEALQALEAAERQLADAQGTWGQLVDVIGSIVAFLALVLGILRFSPVPQLRVVSVAATRLYSRVLGFQGTIIARKAANDLTYTVVQQAIARILKAA